MFNSKQLNWVLAACFALALSGCGTYARTSTDTAPGAPDTSGLAKKNPNQIVLTEGDITNRRYTSLGDISVTVRKVTIFDTDPTQEQVNQALKERAAELGADAVVLVRYGTVGIGLTSWGVLDGNGRAVVFQ